MREFLVILYILCFSAAAFAVETEHTPLLEGVFSVKAFGAAGDGSTKDTKAIQAALDTAAELGGKVYFPPGKYLVDGSLNVPAGVHVYPVGADDIMCGTDNQVLNEHVFTIENKKAPAGLVFYRYT